VECSSDGPSVFIFQSHFPAGYLGAFGGGRLLSPSADVLVHGGIEGDASSPQILLYPAETTIDVIGTELALGIA